MTPTAVVVVVRSAKNPPSEEVWTVNRTIIGPISGTVVVPAVIRLRVSRAAKEPQSRPRVGVCRHCQQDRACDRGHAPEFPEHRSAPFRSVRNLRFLNDSFGRTTRANLRLKREGWLGTCHSMVRLVLNEMHGTVLQCAGGPEVAIVSNGGVP